MGRFYRCSSKCRKEVLSKKAPHKKKPWFTEAIARMMDKRRMAKSKPLEYRQLNQRIKKMCKIAKEDWMKEQCDEVENLERSHAYRTLHQKIKNLTKLKKGFNTGGGIMDKNENLLYETEDKKRRWIEYIEELFDDVRSENGPDIREDLEVPEINMEEMNHAIKKMPNGKATGEDGVASEMFKVLGQNGKKKLLHLLNNILRSGQMPQDFLKSVFVVLPKKAKAVKCSDHRTISLMSHGIKLLLKIILKRLYREIDKEVGETQFGFRADTGTREAIFALRTFCERCLEVQRDVYLCFIDYEKAFDKVQHEKLIEIMNKHLLGKEHVQLIRNLYWKQTAAVRVSNDVTEPIKINRGVRQGCVLSPSLFNLYSEWIFRECEEEISKIGIQVGGARLNNIRYADDTVLIADNENDLKKILSVVNEVSLRYGLKINPLKTKTMVVSRDNTTEQAKPVTLTVNGHNVEQVRSFVYLGTCVTDDGRTDQEVRRRIGRSKSQFMEMRKLLSNSNLNLNIRLRMMECYVWSVLRYGSEMWTLRKAEVRKINAFEMWCYRRILNISWTERKTNEWVLRKLKRRRCLMDSIGKAKCRYLGHSMRRNGVLARILMGKIEGRRTRGRQRQLWIDNIKDWTRLSLEELNIASRSRDRWKRIVRQLQIADAT